MKTFTFRFEPQAWKKASQAMRKAARTGVPDIRGDEMACDSLESMLRIMSKSRFEIFAAILNEEPSSLYDLAKKMGKDQAQILRESRSLEALGLIKLVTVKDGSREKLKPRALYDKIVFEIEPAKATKAG